jgi:hypothetical protein
MISVGDNAGVVAEKVAEAAVALPGCPAAADVSPTVDEPT